MDKTNEIINELNDMADFKGFGESEEEILNADGSRNWQANILLDNVKRLEQENAELKAENELLREENLEEQKQYTEVVSANVQKIRQLKQTLQEIKRILIFYKQELEECLHNDIDGEILDLITKAESEEE